MTIENFTILFSKYIEFYSYDGDLFSTVYSIICCHCWYMLAPPRCWAWVQTQFKNQKRMSSLLIFARKICKITKRDGEIEF
jgi:hypothetical protein